MMLHDPGHFRYLPDDAADLVLSGHTHGGQLGFLSLGIPLTIVGLSGVVPDQGLFARGRMRLYVNRGLGHYGFPLRIGVPAEESILHVALNV
jgi:predicted MPP superfamily phosphohydrolase